MSRSSSVALAYPWPDELPPDLAELARRQGVTLRDETWHADVQGLVRSLRGEPVVPPRRRRRLVAGVAALAVAALAGREVDDNVVFSPHVDPMHVELGRHDRARDDTEVAVGSSREVPCVIHVEPYASAANGAGVLQRGLYVIKVCGPRVMCHHKHHRWPAAAGSTQGRARTRARLPDAGAAGKRRAT